VPTKKNSNETETVQENAPVETDQETTQETAPVNNTDTWTDPKDYGPDNGGNNILAAWQGLYWLFDARVDRFDVTPEGVFAIGLRVNSAYDTDTIVHDISTRKGKLVERRLDLIPAMFHAQGVEPNKFEDSGTMTQFMAQYARGSEGEGNTTRSPEYFKIAIANYKKAQGFASKRGRPAKTIKIENLGHIDPVLLGTLDPEELQMLKDTLEKLLPTV
jgi:hypothetical protein